MANNKIRLGGYLPNHPTVGLHDRLRLFREAGFEVIGITPEGINATSANAVTPRLAHKYGFEIDNVHLTGTETNKLWLDCLEGEDVLDRYCREIRTCTEYGIKKGVTHLTWGSHSPAPVINDLGIERFRRIADYAEKYDFTVVLENSITFEHLEAVFGNVDSKHLAFCWDTGHWSCFTPDYDFMEKYRDRFVCMHLDDNDKIEDNHLMPFDGAADWDKIKRDLASTKYGSELLFFEINTRVTRPYPGLKADEIKKKWIENGVKIAEDEHLVTYKDGAIEAYAKLSYEEYLDRMVKAAHRLAE